MSKGNVYGVEVMYACCGPCRDYIEINTCTLVLSVLQSLPSLSFIFRLFFKFLKYVLQEQHNSFFFIFPVCGN